MKQLGLAGYIADQLLDSPLIPLFLLACFILGSYSLLVIPREDRPDIDVPTAVVVIPWPGGGSERVDEQLARPASAWIRQSAAVTEIRSAATDHAALFVVEFDPGTLKTTAFSQLQEIFGNHQDSLPDGVGQVRINTFGEERLVMFMATLSSRTQSTIGLDQIAGEFAARLETIPGVRTISRHGGHQQAIKIVPDLEAMAAYGISLNQLAKAISGTGRQIPLGILESLPARTAVTGIDISNLEKLAHIPVGEGARGPVYLDDVADIREDQLSQNNAVLYWRPDRSAVCTAITLAVTTQPGINVGNVTRQLRKALTEWQSRLLPSDVEMDISFDAGIESNHRVYNVLNQLLMGTLMVVAIIWLGLGWPAAVIIAIMMPASLASVPFLYNWFGFTLNPVSIAAMILAIGILSDDAVVIIENMDRLYRKAGEKSRELTVKAVNEVGNPTILADLLVVATLLPTAFISGEMGQYVRAIPVGASTAVLFSLLVALTITPYFGMRLLKVSEINRSQPQPDTDSGRPDQRYARMYRAVMVPLMNRKFLRWALYLGLVVALGLSFSLLAQHRVQIGLTPLLDRQVFSVDVELPPGSTLEETLSAVSDVSSRLQQMPEVNSVTIYAGIGAPFIYPPMKVPVPTAMPPHRAVLQVELVPKQKRKALSYEISRRVAGQLDSWLAPYHAQGNIGRIPSGPSSDRPVTAEIYGPDADMRQHVVDRVKRLLREQTGVIAVEQIPDSPLEQVNFAVDPQRAAILGVVPGEVIRTLVLAVRGRVVTDWPVDTQRDPMPVVLRLDKQHRNDEEMLKALYVPNLDGTPIPLEDLVDIRRQPGSPVRYRRDIQPVTTVVADLDRSLVQPLTVQLKVSRGIGSAQDGFQPDVQWMSPPENAEKTTLYWSGEWEMTRDVYQDLGTSGGVVLLIIYLLLAGWFGSYSLPFLIMLPIPLIFIGVIPAHWLWGINIVGTGVLGCIALAGIVARNAILLVDFIRQREKEGMALKEAVIEAGVQRSRPITLTAATVMFGSGVLIFEPSLEPLGLTLASGVLVSTLITLGLIPLLYFQTHA